MNLRRQLAAGAPKWLSQLSAAPEYEWADFPDGDFSHEQSTVDAAEARQLPGLGAIALRSAKHHDGQAPARPGARGADVYGAVFLSVHRPGCAADPEHQWRAETA